MAEFSGNGRIPIERKAADVASMTLYTTWVLLLFWDEPVYLLVSPDAWNGAVLRLLAFAGMLLGLLLAQATYRPFMAAGIHPSVVWRIAAGVAMPFAALCAVANATIVSLSAELAAVCWTLSGAGGSWMLMVLGLKLCLLQTDDAMRNAYHSSALGACIGFAVLLLPSVGQAAALAVVSVLASVAAWLGKPEDTEQLQRLLRNSSSLKGTAQNVERQRLQVQMFVCSFIFAAVQYAALERFGDAYSMGYICVSLLLLALFAALYANVLVERRSIGSMQLTFLALASVGVIVLYVAGVSDVAFLVVCTVTVLGFEGYNSMSKYSLSRTVIVRDLSYVRYFVSGRVANVLGLIAGWGMCMAVEAGLRSISDQMLPYAPAFASTILIAVLIFCNRGGAMTLSAQPERGAEGPDGAAGAWERACEELETAGELTSREREVFRLLARGRDARYISDALYISVHTAKSHVSHIYQKLDAGGHQGLITLVEQRCASVQDRDR